MLAPSLNRLLNSLLCPGFLYIQHYVCVLGEKGAIQPSVIWGQQSVSNLLLARRTFVLLAPCALKNANLPRRAPISNINAATNRHPSSLAFRIAREPEGSRQWVLDDSASFSLLTSSVPTPLNQGHYLQKGSGTVPPLLPWTNPNRTLPESSTFSGTF